MHASETTLTWGDNHVLGYTPMDDIHEECVDLIAQLPELLNAMQAHLQSHFDEENLWMMETEFPPRDCHIEQHDAVLKSVAEVHEVLA
mgnify:CR=1 FL=1